MESENSLILLGVDSIRCSASRFRVVSKNSSTFWARASTIFLALAEQLPESQELQAGPQETLWLGCGIRSRTLSKVLVTFLMMRGTLSVTSSAISEAEL